MSYKDIGSGVVTLIKMLLILLAIFVPLGLWKLIEIAIWLFKNINITWG